MRSPVPPKLALLLLGMLTLTSLGVWTEYEVFAQSGGGWGGSGGWSSGGGGSPITSFGGDLDGSTQTAQWVAAISGYQGDGGSVTYSTQGHPAGVLGGIAGYAPGQQFCIAGPVWAAAGGAPLASVNYCALRSDSAGNTEILSNATGGTVFIGTYGASSLLEVAPTGDILPTIPLGLSLGAGAPFSEIRAADKSILPAQGTATGAKDSIQELTLLGYDAGFASPIGTGIAIPDGGAGIIPIAWSGQDTADASTGSYVGGIIYCVCQNRGGVTPSCSAQGTSSFATSATPCNGSAPTITCSGAAGLIQVNVTCSGGPKTMLWGAHVWGANFQ